MKLALIASFLVMSIALNAQTLQDEVLVSSDEGCANINYVVERNNSEMPNKKAPLKCLDLFSGAGGFSLGFTMAGYEVIGAIEIDKWAAETFQHHHPNAKVIVQDISTVSDEDILAAFPTHPDVIVGGPPCQG